MPRIGPMVEAAGDVNHRDESGPIAHGAGLGTNKRQRYGLGREPANAVMAFLPRNLPRTPRSRHRRFRGRFVFSKLGAICLVESRTIKPGEEFGRLTVIKRLGFNKLHQIEYLARCECGELITVARADLSSGEVYSCGCSPKAAPAVEQHASVSFDYNVVEFFERRVGSKIQVVAQDGRVLDERPTTRKEKPLRD